MRSYRRILALVSTHADSEAVARRAVQLARFHGATLALAAVVDYTPGFDSDHVPFMTPRQVREALLRDVRGRLERLLSGIECEGGREVIVACGEERDVVAELTRSWAPDLVLVGSRAKHGMDRIAGHAPYDVLIVQNGRQGFAGRLVNALAAPL